jgi:hypothetical protein
VPVRLDTAAGLFAAELRLSYDASMLEFVDVRRGSLTESFGWLVKRTEPGVLVVEVAAVHPLAGGTGSLVEVDFRAKTTALGQTLLDLQWASLNDGGLTLNPAPQAGADSTDATLSISAAPASLGSQLASAAPSRSDQMYAPLLAAQTVQARRSEAAPEAAQPVIDWAATAKLESSGLVQVTQGAGRSSWTPSFLTTLGRDDSEPNKNLRIPAVIKPHLKAGAPIKGEK